MKFKLEIECDNDAFVDYCENELSRILVSVAEKLRLGHCLPLNIWDINGNRVGEAVLEGGEHD